MTYDGRRFCRHCGRTRDGEISFEDGVETFTCGACDGVVRAKTE